MSPAGAPRGPTLIVFTREPVAPTTKTRLIPAIGATNAAALAHAFTLDALAKCRSVGRGRLVIAASSPGPVHRSAYFRALARRFGAQLVDQGAGALGARMRRVLEPFCEGGAILIGTDTPSLGPGMLEGAVALLERVPVVLGPSLDGGYYLLGVRGAIPDIFGGVRWGRGAVLAQTVRRLERDSVAYALAPSWYDVDRVGDLAVLIRHLEILARRRRARRPRRAGVLSTEEDPCPATARLLARLGLLAPGG